MPDSDFDLDAAISRLSRLPRRRRTPHQEHPDPRTDSDREYRAAYGDKPFGAKMRAAYRMVIGDAPTSGQDAAAAFVLKIETALEMPDWTAKERGRLMTKRKKWRRRAAGEDGYYRRHGTRGGRPPRGERRSAGDVLHRIKQAIGMDEGYRPEVKYTTEWPLGRPVRK